MTTVYFDWSIRNGVAVLIDDEVPPPGGRFDPSLDAALDRLGPGDAIIGEATFLSFDIDARNAFIDRCQDRGVTLLTTPNRLTSRMRKRMGLPEKSDESDVQAIRELAQDPSRLKAPHPVDEGWKRRKRQAEHHIMVLRRTIGTLVRRPRRKDRFIGTSAKDTQAAEWAAQLPPYQDQPEIRQKALGNGKDWSPVAVAAVGVAATHARSGREFDRMAGLYAHGYPSQIRADLHHWVWAGGNTRAKLFSTMGPDGKRDIPSPAVRLDGLTFSEYRRELRWLFHHLRPVVAREPVLT